MKQQQARKTTQRKQHQTDEKWAQQNMTTIKCGTWNAAAGLFSVLLGGDVEGEVVEAKKQVANERGATE